MLEKKNRIRLDKEFDHVFKTGQSFYSGLMGVKIANNTQNNTRFGFLVGLKVDKKAVGRNKIKRQLREIAGKELPKIKDSFDVVVVALPAISGLDFVLIKKDFQKALRKLNLYKDSNV
jgi:ribonuclease P protein component